MIQSEFWKGKRVFISGNTGFKGSWLSIWLSSMGAKVYGYSLAPSTDPSLFITAEVEKDVIQTIGDIRDLELLKKSIKAANPDIVFHLAAQPLVRESYKDPVLTFSTNVMGTVNLLEAVRSCESVHGIVNVTTDKCYDNKEWLWGYREDEALGGYDPYSSSKACSEIVTAAYRNSFFNTKDFGKSHSVLVASARAGNVIGGGDWSKDRLIPDIISGFESNSIVEIRSPDAVRPWQHVLEPLAGYLLLAQKLCDQDGTMFAQAWNFGPEDRDAQSVGHIVERLKNLWGGNAQYRIISQSGLHEAHYLKLDISKAKSILGWYPTWSLDDALKLIVDFYMRLKNEHSREICLDQIKQFTASW